MVATLLFLVYASAIPGLRTLQIVRFLDLSRELTLAPYVLCVIGGMVVSTRTLYRFAAKFHRVSWVDAANIATRQAAYVALFIFTFMFVTKDRAISRLFLGTYLCMLFGVELLINRGLPTLLSRLLFGRHHRVPTLFVGSAEQIGRLRDWLANTEALGIEPVGFLTPDGAPADESPYPFLGPSVLLDKTIEERMVAQVIVLNIPSSRTEGRALIEICQNRGCRLLIYSNLAEMLQHPMVIVKEEGHTFYSLQEEPLEDPINRVVKRLFDLAVSIPVVLLILPLLCLLVWTLQCIQAPGRLLFRQKRAGQRSNEFSLLKFRSMYDLKHDENMQARQADGRVFPFGRFIRRTSLDEFPQFLNVLVGNMSVVGPRPHMPAHDAEFSHYYRGYRTRHFAKPGITGLAQIRGFRGEITDHRHLQKRVESDLFYIANWSLALDLQITLKTFKHVLFPPTTAY
jgi:exopolysaccharide biosynthesis polyprenyl glycosylphosphotransferase